MTTSQQLERFTWDQATIAGLATARGFRSLGLEPATVRWWASEGLITAVGKAPGGAHLYSIAAVSAAAARPRRKAGRPARSGMLHEHTESPTLGSRQ